MANNRMYLKCKICGESFFLAKFYPSTGYYTDKEYYRDSENFTVLLDFMKSFNKFLDDHRHNDESQWGKWQYEIKYEINRKD